MKDKNKGNFNEIVQKSHNTTSFVQEKPSFSEKPSILKEKPINLNNDQESFLMRNKEKTDIPEKIEPKPMFLDSSSLKEQLNSEKQLKNEENPSEIKEKIHSPLKILTNFLQILTKNRNSLANDFKALLETVSRNEGFISLQEFERFLKNPKFSLKSDEIFSICRTFNYENREKFLGSDFFDSYKSFLLLEDQFQAQLHELFLFIQRSLQAKSLTLSKFEAELNKKADFGYISRVILRETFVKELEISEDLYKRIENLFNLWDELVLISRFFEQLQAIEAKNLLVGDLLEPLVFGESIIEKICIYLRSDNTQKNIFVNILTQKKENSQENEFLDVRESMVFFKMIQFNVSFFECLLIFAVIFKKPNEEITYEYKIETWRFCEYFLRKIAEIKEINCMSPIIENNIKIEENEFDEINDINSLLNEKKEILEKKTEEEQINYQKINEKIEDKLNEKNNFEGEKEDKIPRKFSKDEFMREKREKEENIKENSKLFDEEHAVNNYQHQLKINCVSMTLDLGKNYEGLILKLR